MKKIICASMALATLMPFTALAEDKVCDSEYNRFGFHYCVVFPKGRRGTESYVPGSITMEKLSTYKPVKVQVVTPQQRNRDYRAPLNLNIVRRSPRTIRAEAYQNFLDRQR